MARLFADVDRDAVLELLYQQYGAQLKGERFSLEGRVEPGLVEVTLALERTDRSFRYEMQFYVSLAENRVSEQEARDLVLDFIGYYLDLYFRNERDVLLPLDYQEYPFGEYRVFARGDITNPLLDALADEIIETGRPLPPDDPRLKGLR